MKKSTKTVQARLNDSTVLTRKLSLIERVKSDGTIVIVRLNSFDYFITLDKIAAKVWMLIDGKSTISEIKAQIIRKYKPPRARFERDFSQLVRKLRSCKLLEK